MLQKISLLLRLMLGMVRFGGSLLASYLIASVASVGSVFLLADVFTDAITLFPPKVLNLVVFLQYHSGILLVVFMLAVFIFVLSICLCLFNIREFHSLLQSEHD